MKFLCYFAIQFIIMKNRLCFYILSYSIFFACLSISCNHKTFYQKADRIPNETWNMDSTLIYQFTIDDSLQYYKFFIDVRNNTQYPYQNLSLFFSIQYPDKDIFTDTLTCILSDPYGRWTGKGSGRIKENRFIYKSQVRFMQKGVYTFKVQQAMRDVDLIGITNFGITFNYE